MLVMAAITLGTGPHSSCSLCYLFNKRLYVVTAYKLKVKLKTFSSVSGVSYSSPPWSRNPQLLESWRCSFARNNTSA